jgi:hypothetical protein
MATFMDLLNNNRTKKEKDRINKISGETWVDYDRYSSVRVKEATIVLERELDALYEISNSCIPTKNGVGLEKSSQGYATTGCGYYVFVLGKGKRIPKAHFLLDTGNYHCPECPLYYTMYTQNMSDQGIKLAHHFGRGD